MKNFHSCVHEAIYFFVKNFFRDNYLKSCLSKIVFASKIFLFIFFSGHEEICSQACNVNEYVYQNESERVIHKMEVYPDGYLFTEAVSDAASYLSDVITRISYHAPLTERPWVVFGNGLFMAVSTSSPSGNPTIIVSPDGKTWASEVSSADNNWKDLIFASGKLVQITDSKVCKWIAAPPNPSGTLPSEQTKIVLGFNTAGAYFSLKLSVCIKTSLPTIANSTSGSTDIEIATHLPACFAATWSSSSV